MYRLRYNFIRNTSGQHIYMGVFKLYPSRNFSHATLPRFPELPTNDGRVEISPMDEENLKKIAKHTAKEGWNPGKYEATPLLTAAGSGFKVMKLDDEPIACLCSVKYKNFAFLGHYFVVDKFRGQGFGKFLWNAVLKELETSDTIGLNGVIQQIGNYERSGFVKTQHHNIRWFGEPKKLKERLGPVNIKLHNTYSMNKLIDYDANIFSTSREAFLRKWVEMPGSSTFIAIDDKGNLKGYACVSLSEDGYKIAPLFADTSEVAEQLYRNLVEWVGEKGKVYLDTCENNPEAIELARQLGLKELFRSLPMWKGGCLPTTHSEKVFSITSQELGIK